ncbi:protein At-4/1-like isoform X2 [Punica granatum]|uniref:Protein At-4/1-like isoform X2 n=1 Tax=Punica granatum TaxID=22663 RepID=A0A6P8C7W9_PUNGR|nr:protein At-4/1-like isoform X2 [Punica granatum]
MAATSDREMELLLSSFDQIYQDFKSGMEEIQLLKSNCQAETKRREALEIACHSVKQDNERLTKLYTNSMKNLAGQLEHHLKCQRLEEELKRVTAEHQDIENEHKRTLEGLKQDYAAKFGELEAQIRSISHIDIECSRNALMLSLADGQMPVDIRCFESQKQSDEATINHLCQDLAAHKSHIHSLASRLEQGHFYFSSKYQAEIQDLRDCLLLEQEEKNGLSKKLQALEKECFYSFDAVLMSRTKLAQGQKTSVSSQQVEALKQKIMKLRRENEILRRKLQSSQEG